MYKWKSNQHCRATKQLIFIKMILVKFFILYLKLNIKFYLDIMANEEMNFGNDSELSTQIKEWKNFTYPTKGFRTTCI